ncbi:hypothetical protein CNR22_12020 [Sphingobacteriaceae bacterium]|nr:hypothetical protein CNR22_12020 [Sphingobacteriaceae bacterium]
MDISFSIISRGAMVIIYDQKKVVVSGELTFDPPVFYADLSSLRKWEKEDSNGKISDKEKKEILDYFASQNSTPGRTKIIFD